MKERLQELQKALEERYHPQPGALTMVARAPGRVNLIGEHTDYNDGFVLPIAIDRDMLMVGTARADRQVRLFSIDLDQESVFSLDAIGPDQTASWSNYPRGVLDVLQKEGHELVGMDVVLTGNVPQASGLSSSAALEVATGMLASALAGLEIAPVAMARLAQRAENEFVGVQCGIMDQFISRLGRKNHALLIDCRTYDYRHIPWPSSKVSVLITDTRVKRGLVDSEYNRRRQECQAGVETLAAYIAGITALRDVSTEQFEAHAAALDPVVRDRCQHVVYENQRVHGAVKAMEAADWQSLGRLMDESHDSLRDLFQVSCKELDAVVNIARQIPGVYGARMTGAGFGGCAIALVDTEALPTLKAAIEEQYPRMTGIEPRVLETGLANGAEAWVPHRRGSLCE